MATNYERESAPNAADESNEPVLSMVDVLEEEKQLEDDANAVLGASDDTNCTYPLGYVHRQALYACATCCNDSRRAGVCLACSLECHEGHHLYELYTKRSMRCDCGNGKFPSSFKCKLIADKCTTNIDNKYNHNFSGLYCSCSRPYPDPEDEVEDDMIQCVVCEDWFHGRHLGTDVPDEDEYDEMVCGGCMKSCDFLWPYAVHSVNVLVTKSDTDATVDVEGCSSATSAGEEKISEAKVSAEGALSEDVKSENGKESETVAQSESASPENGTKSAENYHSEQDENQKVDAEKSAIVEKSLQVLPSGSADAVSAGSELKECHLEELKRNEFTVGEGATFWKSGWRSKLCSCDHCKKMYLERDVSFLSDETDTISAYENRGKDASCVGTSRYDKGMHELSKMHRMQQVDLLHGYNDMKSELTQYLRKFAENGKVVREEDIKEFFGQMQARKKQRVSVPFHCR